MKSIVEEASSIAKAIENGWVRAGKPQEFTVRIFEESEKNFLGFNKKPAKVGLFYNEAPVQQQGRSRDQKRQQPRPQIVQRGSGEKNQPAPRPQPERRTTQAPKQQVSVQQPETPKLPEQPKQSKWTPELVDGSKEWIKTILKTINKDTIPFTIESKQYFLTIRFATPVLSDKRKEQLLFRNWSHLLLQVLRHKYKRGLRGYKIIITSAA